MGKVISVFCDGSTPSLYNIKEVNSSFATASLDIMYVGENRNGSNIEKEVVEAALPTLYNVPVVANWDPESREIGGHDVEIVRDDEGGMKVRNLTVPCGVITDHTVFSFNKKKDDNGVEHEYLTADGVVLWKRQDIYDYIVNERNGVIPHSMEIEVESGDVNEETSYYDVGSFQFTALCLLGSATPCFEGSKLQVYSESASNSLKDELSEMMKELKEFYSLNATADAGADKTTTEGGELMTEEKAKLIEEFGIDVDTLDFSVEDLTVEELRAKFEQMTASMNTDGEDEGTTPDEESAKKGSISEKDGGGDAKFELNNNIQTELKKAVSNVKAADSYGYLRPSYWFVDYEQETSTVFFESVEDGYLYGAPFTMDGDSVNIDFASCRKKKYAIVDFVEGSVDNKTTAFDVASAMDEQFAAVIAEKDEAIQKYAEIAEKLESVESELETLRKFKIDTETAIATENIASVFAQFEDLAGNESFEALKSILAEDCMKYDIETIEEKCFAIRGRMNTKATFSMVKTPKFSIENTKDDTDTNPYGGLVEEFRGK